MGIFTKIVGISHNQETLKTCKTGDFLKLKREINNQYDKYAVSVWTKENKLLGYLNKLHNISISNDMGAGRVFNCEIETISGKGKELLGCNIHIYEKENKTLTINDGMTKFIVKERFVSFEFQNQTITIRREDFEKCYKHYMELQR